MHYKPFLLVPTILAVTLRGYISLTTHDCKYTIIFNVQQPVYIDTRLSMAFKACLCRHEALNHG